MQEEEFQKQALQYIYDIEEKLKSMRVDLKEIIETTKRIEKTIDEILSKDR